MGEIKNFLLDWQNRRTKKNGKNIFFLTELQQNTNVDNDL